MHQRFHLLFIIILAITVAGCSSAPVRIEPVVGINQSVSYERGQIKLATEEDHLLAVTVVDYVDDQVVIGVSVSNYGNEPFDFAESNVTGKLVSADGSLPVDIYRYEAVAKDLDTQEYEAMKQAGWASVGVGSIFVPFGGIAVSAARLLLSLGQLGAASDDQEVDPETVSQLKQIYLRRHTLLPGTDYGGLLRIGLPDKLENGDALLFTVTAEQEAQTFKFLSRQKAR